MTENTIELLTLAQLSQGQDWRVQLCHDRPVHMLIWITRGQGLLQLDGQRRGLGAHNAVFIPARALFALDMGRQGIGQAVLIPDGNELRLPQMPRHLRIRDVQAQTELTGLYHDALEGHAALMSVWLRRQIMQDEHVPNRRNAAARLSARFCQMVCEHYSSGAPMAQYAESLEVTPTHLSRAVKSATGKTAADILTERVVHEARHLLGTTEHSAQDIARHLGFGSAAYFTRFMQQHTGLTPSRLRATAT